MLKTIMFSILMRVANYLTSKEFAATVKTRVEFYLDEDIKGSEKKARLMADLKELYGEVKDEISGFAPHLVNLVVEIMVARAKVEASKK